MSNNEVLRMNSPRVREILALREERAREMSEHMAGDRAWQEMRRIGGRSVNLPLEGVTHSALRDGMWAGRRCFIVGGGESLKGFDFSRLRGELVIGVNRAFEFCACDILFAMDEQVYQFIVSGKFGPEVRQKFMDFAGHKVWLDITGKVQLPGVEVIRACGQEGIPESLERGVYHGDNSGYAALNLAIALGASPIYLLGFDMRGEWFHDGYPNQHAASAATFAGFIRHFENTAPAIAARGIKVINLNPQSALKCFDFGRSEDIWPKTAMDYRRTPLPPVPIPMAMPQKLEPPVFFAGPLGFGDNINLRIVIRHLAQKHEAIYLQTTIPEVFWDLPRIKFVKPISHKLRTQNKHIASFPANFFCELPKGITQVGPWGKYTPLDWRLQPDGNRKQADFPGEEITVSECIRRRAGIPREDFDFTLPVKREWVAAARNLISGLDLRGKKLCIVRPNTLRPEWLCPTRNPKTEHYQTLIDFYRDEYFFLSVADLEPGQEWLDGELRGLDTEFHHGELPWSAIFGLIKLSDMFITNPGWGMLAGIALRAKTFCVFGGELHPRYFIDEQIGIQNFGYVAPEPFCNCFKMEHACNKEIPRGRVVAAFEELRVRPKWEKRVTVGFAPGLGDAHWPLLKLESFKEKNAIDKLKVAIHNRHDYPLEFVRHVPFVDEVIKSPTGFPFRMSLAGGDGRPLDAGANGADCIMEFGSRLEAGVPLEQILPEYDTNWDYEIQGLDEHWEFVADLRKKAGGRLVVFYPSSKGSNKGWARGQWTAENWQALARLIQDKNGCPPVLVGAEFDRDYAQVLTFDGCGPLFIDLVGQTPIMKTLAILRGSDLVLGFSAGIPIMATHFRVPTVIFWPVRGVSEYQLYNPLFMRSWIPPWSKDNYFGFAYGAPETTPAGVFRAVEKFL